MIILSCFMLTASFVYLPEISCIFKWSSARSLLWYIIIINLLPYVTFGENSMERKLQNAMHFYQRRFFSAYVSTALTFELLIFSWQQNCISNHLFLGSVSLLFYCFLFSLPAFFSIPFLWNYVQSMPWKSIVSPVERWLSHLAEYVH